jgi:hypothetical protein
MVEVGAQMVEVGAQMVEVGAQMAEVGARTGEGGRSGFMKRWDMMLSDLHYASILLNPFLMNIIEIQNNGIANVY